MIKIFTKDFLSMCYIARASYNFWYNVAISTKNPWHKFLTLNISKRPNRSGFLRAIKAAAVDAWTYISDWNEGYDPAYESPVEIGPTQNNYYWQSNHAKEMASQASAAVKNETDL